MTKKIVSMTLNGRKVEEAVEPRTLLVHFLREKMSLTPPTRLRPLQPPGQRLQPALAVRVA
ncbi:MAG: hypothetical protein Q7T63_20595 [Burkholderiaceae bacterium]|nr:hypothetical protein [Burkholderiaceae bacterium]